MGGEGSTGGEPRRGELYYKEKSFLEPSHETNSLLRDPSGYSKEEIGRIEGKGRGSSGFLDKEAGMERGGRTEDGFYISLFPMKISFHL